MQLRSLASAALLVLLIAACGPSEEGPGDEAPAAALEGVPTASSETAQTWVYWLQDIDLDVLGARCEGLAVIDYTHDGSDEGAFTREEIGALKQSPGGEKTVLAYMSIGEAEDYRSYWDDAWRDPARRPAWLERENPNWPGNVKVRYWDPAWQRVILGSPESYLDRIMAAGFDGVYLDIIDAYDYFQERGRASAEAEMVAFVRAISTYAKARDPDFLIIPQNAPELGSEHADYLAAVDGVGQEGLHYGYEEQDEATAADVAEEIAEHLDAFRDAGKLVLVVDYATTPALVDDAYGRSRAKGYVAAVTTVALDQAPLGGC